MTDSKNFRTAHLLSALASGALFGFGLVLSQMVNPAKVIGFLDVAGAWDPTLAVVLGGALLVSAPAFHWILKQPHPLFAARFSLPTRTDIEPRLVIGAALFGIGWGIAGFCPGPAITALVTLAPPILIFVGAMLGGAWLYERSTLSRGR